jgi:protein TonB
MFQQSLIEGTARTNKGWSVFLSLGIQTGLIGALLLVPMLNPELLPKTILQSVLSAPTPPPGPPPRPEPAAVTHSTRTQARPTNIFVAPRSIPTTVAMITDEPPAAATYSDSACLQCVPGGIGTPAVAQPPRVVIDTPPPVVKPAAVENPIIRVRQGGDVQEAKLISRVQPVYPPLARQTRTQGVVRFSAIIGRDGTIQNLTLISGHPLLSPAAAAAVRQWRYRPTYLNGDPVEVVTEIEVHFILN